MLATYPKQIDFIHEFSHSNCVKRYHHINTLEKAYLTKYLKLSELESIYNPQTPLFFIEAWLNGLIIFLGFEKVLADYQLTEIAQYIYDEIKFLNIVEFTLLFKRIKTGHYGEFYGRISGTDLIRWCREYRKERGRVLSKLPSGELG